IDSADLCSCLSHLLFLCPLTLSLLLFFLRIRPPPRSTLFPYTTLFRSVTLLTFASLFSHINIGIRHILVLYPFLAIGAAHVAVRDRKSTRLNSSHSQISYAVFCLKKKIQHPPAFRFPVRRCFPRRREVS